MAGTQVRESNCPAEGIPASQAPTIRAGDSSRATADPANHACQPGSISSGAWRCWDSCSCLPLPGRRRSAHAHSLIQLWTDANNGTVRHHVDHGGCIRVQAFPLHGLIHPLALPDRPRPWASMTSSRRRGAARVGACVERRAPAPDRHDGDCHPGMCQVPIAVPHRRYSGLSRILVPPPRWIPPRSESRLPSVSV